MRKWFEVIAVSVVAFVGLILGANQISAQAKSDKSIRVVTSVDFYGSVAQSVLGKHGTVTSVINSPSVDPHDFEPTTKDGKLVAKADVVVSNGVGYDGWMQKLSKASGNDQQVRLRVGEDVLGKKVGANEHLWYQPATMGKLATALAKQFGELSPQYKMDYEKNAQRYIKSLAPLQKQIADLKAGHSADQRVDVSEPVFDYALDALNYQRNNKAFELAVENGTDPAPKDINAIRKDITQHRIAFFVNNTQASDKTVTTLVKLAKQHHVPVLNVTETLPKGKTYLTWMQGQYKQLAKIQAQQKH